MRWPPSVRSSRGAAVPIHPWAQIISSAIWRLPICAQCASPLAAWEAGARHGLPLFERAEVSPNHPPEGPQRPAAVSGSASPHVCTEGAAAIGESPAGAEGQRGATVVQSGTLPAHAAPQPMSDFEVLSWGSALACAQHSEPGVQLRGSGSRAVRFNSELPNSEPRIELGVELGAHAEPLQTKEFVTRTPGATLPQGPDRSRA